ncbi:uncharacterized protein LOC114309774 [Camellia sinensis]|uniref:uncharacterized protein LOC114309774 n=1 Tax=Camellia sinensis TaxID=4442 RepID=UPI0010364B40|nr:uncharacterized protein LOC114309774 [Camellia sinensis]
MLPTPETDTDAESSYPPQQSRKQKKDKKGKPLCRTCYPISEYEGFDAVQFIKMVPHATRPIRATDGAVGYDLTSIAMYVIPAYGRTLISTGLAMEIPCGMYGRIAPRSGLALLHGIDVGAGVIDPDYRGEIKVLLFNHNQEEFEVRAGDRIAQIIFEKVSLPRMVEKDARNLCDIRNDERERRPLVSLSVSSGNWATLVTTCGCSFIFPSPIVDPRKSIWALAIFIFVGLRMSPFFLQISNMDFMCFTCVLSSGEKTRISSM